MVLEEEENECGSGVSGKCGSGKWGLDIFLLVIGRGVQAVQWGLDIFSLFRHFRS